MPCLFGRSEAEKAELRELLELSNSQREEYRKAADASNRRADHLAKQLEARLLELQDLSSHYQALQQHESQVCRENEGLQQQLATSKQALGKAAAAQDDLSKRLQREAAARKQAEADVRKLHKEREYLKMRVDRMQHALSILESVMDDTLRVSQSAGSGAGVGAAGSGGSMLGDLKHSGGGSSTAAALRQSMDAASVAQLQAMIRSSKMGDAMAAGDQM